MYYGERLKQIRASKNLSTRKLSEKVGDISHVNLIRIENGGDSKGKIKDSIPINTLQKILNALDYDFALFLAETGYINPERVCMNDAEADLLKAFRGNYDNNFIELNKNKSEKVEKGLEIGK